MTLAEQLTEIVAANKLSALSINVHPREDGTSHFYSYAHADSFVGSSGHEDVGPAEAIAHALADLNAKRFPVADVPQLEAA